MTGPRPLGPDDIGASITLSAEAFGDLPAGFTPPSPDSSWERARRPTRVDIPDVVGAR